MGVMSVLVAAFAFGIGISQRQLTQLQQVVDQGKK